MSDLPDTKLDSGQRRTLSNRIHYIAPLLEMDGQFITRDVAHDDARNAVRFAKEHGAVERCGERKIERGYEYTDGGTTDYVCVWRWRANAREWLRAYLDDVETLPCGHRAHICNSPKVDGYSCRKCIENGDHPDYSRDVLERAGVVG